MRLSQLYVPLRCSARCLQLSKFPLTLARFAHQLPFYGLICFACYLGGRLGLAILTFNDCPEAHKELQKEIEQAKADLRSKNVDVD